MKKITLLAALLLISLAGYAQDKDQPSIKLSPETELKLKELQEGLANNNMPILKPDPTVQFKILVKKPAPAITYHIQLVKPDDPATPRRLYFKELEQ